MTHELEVFMHGLPVQINNFAQARKFVKRFGGNTLLGGRSMRAAIDLIDHDELIYYLGHATLSLKDKLAQAETGHLGTIVLSNKRLFIRIDLEKNRVLEFPLCDVLSVGARAGMFLGKVSFATSNFFVEFDTYGNATQKNLTREMFIHVTAAAPSYAPGQVSQPLTKQKRVVECLGCSAVVIVEVGAVAHCEYCNRPVDSEMTLQAQTPMMQHNWQCTCGRTNQDPFCGGCGARQIEMNWTCSCGRINTDPFCGSCGSSRA